MSESSTNGNSPLMLATPTFDMGESLLSLSRTSYGCENDMDTVNQFISEFDSRTNTYRRITTPKSLEGNSVGTFGNITLNEFQCDICYKVLTRKEHLKSHKLLHDAPKIWKCEICEREFNRRDHLKRHMDTHKPKGSKTGNAPGAKDEETPKDEEMKEKDEEENGVDEKSVIDIDEKSVDEKIEEKEDKIEDESEDKDLESDENVDQLVVLGSSDRKLHQCPTCLKEFKRKSHLTRHLLTHVRKQLLGPVDPKIEAEKLYQCEFCQKRFGRKDHLKRHELTHTDFRQYKCAHCPKSFHQRTGLTRHELTHFPPS